MSPWGIYSVSWWQHCKKLFYPRDNLSFIKIYWKYLPPNRIWKTQNLKIKEKSTRNDRVDPVSRQGSVVLHDRELEWLLASRLYHAMVQWHEKPKMLLSRYLRWAEFFFFVGKCQIQTHSKFHGIFFPREWLVFSTSSSTILPFLVIS